jgi:hypothetical protein
MFLAAGSVILNNQDEPLRRTAIETKERLASIETRMAERWTQLRGEFEWFRSELLKFDRRLAEREMRLVVQANSGPKGSPMTVALKEQQWLLIAALIVGAMLGKAGINPAEWFLS